MLIAFKQPPHNIVRRIFKDNGDEIWLTKGKTRNRDWVNFKTGQGAYLNETRIVPSHIENRILEINDKIMELQRESRCLISDNFLEFELLPERLCTAHPIHPKGDQ